VFHGSGARKRPPGPPAPLPLEALVEDAALDEDEADVPAPAPLEDELACDELLVE
jgi:hypothetical protein